VFKRRKRGYFASICLPALKTKKYRSEIKMKIRCFTFHVPNAFDPRICNMHGVHTRHFEGFKSKVKGLGSVGTGLRKECIKLENIVN
jgi:hypothetical protein